MKPKPEDFDDLLALLSIKRHEQPPPDYFKELPHLVLARIQIGQEREPVSWWQRWCGHFEGRPILVGAYCVAVCGLLFSGLSLSKMAAEDKNLSLLDDNLLEIATMRQPLTFDQVDWKPVSMSDERLPNLNPLQSIEPATFQYNILQLKGRPAGLFFEGN